MNKGTPCLHSTQIALIYIQVKGTSISNHTGHGKGIRMDTEYPAKTPAILMIESDTFNRARLRRILL